MFRALDINSGVSLNGHWAVRLSVNNMDNFYEWYLAEQNFLPQ